MWEVFMPHNLKNQNWTVVCKMRSKVFLRVPIFKWFVFSRTPQRLLYIPRYFAHPYSSSQGPSADSLYYER